MRRFTCLTYAFSKKLDNHIAMSALFLMHCNYRRVHQTLRVTPPEGSEPQLACVVYFGDRAIDSRRDGECRRVAMNGVRGRPSLARHGQNQYYLEPV
jgi:hypothetical protein